MKKLLLGITLMSSFSTFAQTKCLMAPFYTVSYGKEKISPTQASILEAKGYRILSKKEFRLMANQKFEHNLVFVSSASLYFAAGVFGYYKPGHINSFERIKVSVNITPKAKKIIIADHNKAILESIAHLETDFSQTNHASEKERIRAEIVNLRHRYDSSLDIVIPGESSEEAFFNWIPNCSDIN